jgi:hypothetical protein
MDPEEVPAGIRQQANGANLAHIEVQKFSNLQIYLRIQCRKSLARSKAIDGDRAATFRHVDPTPDGKSLVRNLRSSIATFLKHQRLGCSVCSSGGER